MPCASARGTFRRCPALVRGGRLRPRRRRARGTRALAATLTASVESPRDPALPAARDISRVDSTFDDETGTWSITITRYGETDGPDWAAINATLFAAPAAGAACGRADDSIALLRATTIPGSTDVVGSIDPTTAIRRAAIVSQDGDTLTVTDPGLVGRRPACLNANLSRNRVLDGVTAIPFTSGGTAGEPTPTPTPEPPPLRGVHAPGCAPHPEPHRPRDDRARTVRARGLRLGHRPSRAPRLGRATFRARAGDPVLVRAWLTAAARRLLAGGQLSVRLVATARAGDESVSRFTAATLLRPRA